MSNLIPLDEAAEKLGLAPDALMDLVKQGEVRGFKSGNTFKFKLDDLQRYAAAQGVDFGGAGSGSDLSGDINLISDSLDLGSDLQLAADGGSDVLTGGDAKTGESPSDTGKMGEGAKDEDDLLLAEDDLFESSDIALASSDIVDSDSDLGDSDLVLDDSSSELGLKAHDSGINLRPSDSGLSLEEEPKDFDSDIDSLALPEDDSLLGVDDLGSDIRPDDDFVLTPVDDSSADDETSGSQVIALDDSEIYSEGSASGLLADSVQEESAPVLVFEEPALFQEGVVGGGGSAQPAGFAAVPSAPEAPYSIFNVMALMLVFFFVCLGMLLVFDNARNMWNKDDATSLTKTVAGFVVNMVGLDKTDAQ